MSWDWRRRAIWSSSSPADQSRSIRKPRSPGEGRGEGAAGGEEGGSGSLSGEGAHSP